MKAIVDFAPVIDEVHEMLLKASDNATEKSIAVAMDRVKGMVSRYNASHLAELDEHLAKKGSSVLDMNLFDTNYRKGFPVWMHELAIGIGNLLNCKMNIRISDDGYQYIRCYGYQVDLQVAHLMFLFSVNEINRMTMEAAAADSSISELSGPDKTLWKRGHSLMIVRSILGELAPMMRKHKDVKLPSGAMLSQLKREVIEGKYGKIDYVELKSDDPDQEKEDPTSWSYRLNLVREPALKVSMPPKGKTAAERMAIH